MAVIIPKHGTTAPTTGLTQYEIAIDTTNKRVYVGNSGGAGDLIGSSPGGSDTYVQFNDGGLLGGDAGLTYNKTTDSLTMAGDLAVNGGDITTSTTTATIFNTTATTVTAFGAATTCTLGYSGLSSSTTNIATGSLNSGQTKTINLGTGAAANRTTTVNIGGAGGFIYLNSPTFIADSVGNNVNLYASNIFGNDAALTLSSTINGVFIDGGSMGGVQLGDLSGIGNLTKIVIDDVGSTISFTSSGPLGVQLQSQAELRFFEATVNGTNYVGFKAPSAITTNRIWTLPSADGTSGQVLSTNGSGTLSWATAGGSASGSDTQIQFNDGGTAFGGDAGLTYVKASDTLSVGVSSTAGTINIRGAGELRFNDGDSSNYVSLKSATTVSSNVSWTLPSADGSAGQFLQTDGSGTLSWASNPAVIDYLVFNSGII